MLRADELQVFHGVNRWMNHNQEERLEDAKLIGEHIRLPLIDTDELLGVVESSGFISSDRLIKVVKLHHKGEKGEGVEFTPRGTVAKLPMDASASATGTL